MIAGVLGIGGFQRHPSIYYVSLQGKEAIPVSIKSRTLAVVMCAAVMVFAANVSQARNVWYVDDDADPKR